MDNNRTIFVNELGIDNTSNIYLFRVNMKDSIVGYLYDLNDKRNSSYKIHQSYEMNFL